MRKILDFFINGKFLNSLWFWGIAISLTCFVITQKGCKREQEKVPNLEYKVPEKTYVDEKGKEHSQQTTESVSTRVLDRLVDSLISENKNLRKAISLVQVSVRIDTVFRERIKWLDTISGDFEITKKDQWIDITAKGNVKSGDGQIELKTYDTLNVVMRRKNNLFSPDEIIADVSLASPYQQVDKMRSYSLNQKRNLITFGPQIGYNVFTGKINYGIGATLNLISIKVNK